MVVDTDIGLRNLDVVMGLENRIVYNLVDVVNGNCRMKQALIKDKKSKPIFAAFRADEGQIRSLAGTDDKTHRCFERGI